MKLEDQVCSLGLAKRLKELGVKQESLLYWGNTKGQPDQSCWQVSRKVDDTEMEWISCFTVAEMGEMLPYGTTYGHDVIGFYAMIESGSWRESAAGKNIHHAATEADARAKMLIYLIEKGLVKP